MAKAKKEEVVTVEGFDNIEVVEEVVASPKLLRQLRGKDIILVEFVGERVSLKDSEGTGYTLPLAEYLDLVNKE
jgi:hypothetical protein